MEVMDSHTPWNEHAPDFSGHIVPGILVRRWCFRSEREYHSESSPELFTRTLIPDVAKILGVKPFLLYASDPRPRSAVRSWKGALWTCKALRAQPHELFENQCVTGETRLCAVVDLSQFGFELADDPLLNFLESIIVFSNTSLGDVTQMIQPWISTNRKEVLSFDYDSIASTLQKDASIGVLRCFLPHEPRPETIVIIAHEHFVSGQASASIDDLATRVRNHFQGSTNGTPGG
jgi:hypothetical protein